jgi:hypothetical protein
MNVAFQAPIEKRPYEVEKRVRDAMSSRALLLKLRRLHYEYAPKTYKDRFLPVLPPPPIVREPSPAFIELWGDVKAVLINDVKRAVCRHYKVTGVDLVSQRRTADIVMPRQIAMYLCRHLTLKSLPEISRSFGKRDHTTCMHAVRKIENMLLWNKALVADVSAITQGLRA